LKTISTNLAVYGLAHGVVDAVCVAVLFRLLAGQATGATEIPWLFLAYNLLAFGLQAFCGLLVDRYRWPRPTAILGIGLVTGAAFMPAAQPFPAVALAGIGNALFHVGGGVIALSLTPRKATAPGIFVAPGALGVLAGVLMGKSGMFNAWVFLPVMAALCAAILLAPKPEMYRARDLPAGQPGPLAGYVLFLILFVIAVRSLVGAVMVFPWKTDISLLIVLTVSIALGKGLGGFLADRFGWARIAVGSLAASIPLLTFGTGLPALAMLGMFLFNFTMPVTLTAISNCLPGRPGFAFGLTCLGLILGALPAFSDLQFTFNGPVVLDTAIAASAAALYFGLRQYRRLPPASTTPRDVIPENTRGELSEGGKPI
jgi:FSR family fosmidomycin resistance protein-like MFS transporter